MYTLQRRDLLQSSMPTLSEAEAIKLQQDLLQICRQRTTRRPGGGRKRKYKEFLDIVPRLMEFTRLHDWNADARRRVSTSRAEGFRLVDALYHLYANVPGLYQSGFSKDSVARMFVAPKKTSRAAKHYHCLIDARVELKRNNQRSISKGTHFGRAQQKLLKEWHAFHEQPFSSGDDMNIINVGRPAVSRYHQQRRFYRIGHGPDHEVHDFPTAELGLKLGGFMFLGGKPKRSSRYVGDLD